MAAQCLRAAKPHTSLAGSS
jgi:hypothetical protein